MEDKDIKKLFNRNILNLKDLSEEEKATMKVNHYTLHLPNTATKEQLTFINDIAKNVIGNQPITVVHEKAMQFLLRVALQYRNVLIEFDEDKRWTDSDEESFQKILKEFKPMLDWIMEEYRIKVERRET